MARKDGSGALECSTDRDRTAWIATYAAMGAVLLVICLIHCIISRGDLCGSRSREEHGLFAAQLTFIAGIFTRGLGMVMSSLIIAKKWNWGRYSLLSSGLPGYFTGIAYCFIFFSWCSVVVDFLARAATGFYEKSKRTMVTLLVMILVGFAVSFGCMFSSSPDVAHWVEAGIATFRDLAIATAFILYTVKVSKMLDSPCSKCGSPEMNIIVVCLILIIGLIGRAVSIMVYMVVTRKINDPSFECSMEYLGIFIFEQLLCEFLPLCAIFANRVRTEILDREAQRNDDKFRSFI